MFSPKILKSFKKSQIFSLYDKKSKKSIIKKLKNNYKSLSDNEKTPKDSASFTFSLPSKLEILDKDINLNKTIIKDKNKKCYKIKQNIYNDLFLKNYGDMGDEKLKLKNILNDLISWGNNNKKMKNNINDYKMINNININVMTQRIKKMKFSKSELINFIKNNIDDNNKHNTSNILENDETKYKLLKLKFSVFDKDFNSNKYKEQEKTIKKEIIKNNRKIENVFLEKENHKLFQIEQKQNELKERESYIYLYKKLVLNKLKKKKYLELLDETYRLLEKARIEYQLSVDILTKRYKSAQNYYIAFINIFKGKIIKLNETKIKRKLSGNNIIIDEKENKNNLEKREFSPDINKLKNRYSIIGYEDKLKKYREYLSIIEEINNEINRYEKKFNSIQNDLNNILDKAKKKIEEINIETSQIKIIYKEVTNKQTKYYLNILKKGIDTRMEGLTWVVKRLLELNAPIDSTIFPSFLDQEQIDYIIQISKYGYEITQLKIILDNLREKNTEVLRNEIKYNNSLYIQNDKNLSISNVNTSTKRSKLSQNSHNESSYYKNQLMINCNKSKILLSKYSKIINRETQNLQIENDLVKLILKNAKNKMGLYARDKSFDINDKRDIKNNIQKFILSNDKQKEYFHDVFILVDRIKELNNLIKELKKEELLIFGEKFKFADLKEETTKTFYWQVFNALFGNAIFK